LVGQNSYQRNNCEEILKINLDFVCERERERDLEREREQTERERENKQTHRGREKTRHIERESDRKT
jgi:hypothetical protein